MEPRIAIAPREVALFADAVRAGGGVVAPAEEADGLVWLHPTDTDGLRAILERSPARWVQLPFAGIEAFVDAGVVDAERTWTCAKGIYGHATAEQALALMLAAARLIHEHVLDRRWWGRETGRLHRRLAGTTAVVVGTGGIGRALAEMLAPLRVRVLAVNRSGRAMPGAERTERVDTLPDLVAEADWLVLAAALTDETRNLVSASLLERMRPEAWLVNVARGAMVDTDALVAALTSKRLAGAALDVTEPEPLPDDHPLWRFDNVIITGHTANTVEMGAPELAALVRRNVERFAAGEPLEGIVDPALGY